MKQAAEFKKSRLRVESRQKEAAAREDARSKRTAKQQLNLLDKRLGKGVGAVKERARLAKEIAE